MGKVEMRAAMSAILRSIPPAERAERSARASRRLTETDAWRRASAVLCFLSMPHEIDTDTLIGAARAQGKTVAVPRIEREDISFVVMPAQADDLRRDRWGIPVPEVGWSALNLARSAPILVVTPGLAFDRHGNRLGRGKGYYDRFLTGARAAVKEITAVGILFHGQLVDEVPHGPTDQRVDGIVTDTETIFPLS